MNHPQISRRQFLKISALLPIGSALLCSPALAHFNTDSSERVAMQNRSTLASPRSDIRNLDFDSHNFPLNSRRYFR